MVGETRSSESSDSRARAKRYISHALVEVRKLPWLPLFCQSAVLLDISVSGFKLEFVGETEVAPGSQHWLFIPLAPLGIAKPSRFVCRCECRWFDKARFRIGGTFLNLTVEDQAMIELIVTSLKTRGRL